MTDNAGDGASGLPPPPSFWRTNRGIGLGLSIGFGLLLAYLLASDWVYLRLRDGFYLGGFSVAGVLLMLGLSLVLVFDRHRHEVPEQAAEVRSADWLRALAILVGAWLLFEVSRLLSALIAAPVFLFATMYLFGVRPWTVALLSAVVVGGTVYAVFRLLGIELPHGALSF